MTQTQLLKILIEVPGLSCPCSQMVRCQGVWDAASDFSSESSDLRWNLCERRKKAEQG